MADNNAPATQPEMNEIAAIAREVNLLFFGTTLLNTDPTLMTRGGSRGLSIYEDIKRDCHAGAVLDKRRLAVVSRDWDVAPASDSRIDKKAAELVKSAFSSIEFDRICGNLLEAVLNGYSVAEVIWGMKAGAIVPVDIKARAARRFVMSIDGQPRLKVRENVIQGIELPDRKFIVQRFGASDDFPYGLGLGSALFWPVFFKRQDITFWLKFADKFGSPTAVGKYQPGASPSEQDKLLAALGSISNDAGIIVPEGMLIELLQIASTTDNYEKLARYMDEQISERVLGETMSTTSGGAGLGSSQADVHDEVRLEIAQADANMLNATLNATVVRWICDYNFPGAGTPMVTRAFDEAEDLNTTAERDGKLYAVGWERTEESMTETYGPGYVRRDMAAATLGPDGLPIQPGSDPVAGAPGAGAPSAGDVSVFAENASALHAANKDAQDHLQAAATAAASDWQALMGPKVKRLQAVLGETGDLVAFREALTRLVDEPPSDDLVDRLARGSFAAHVMGRGPAKKASKAGLLTRLLGRNASSTSA
jgi:phage gp29-like protein